MLVDVISSGAITKSPAVILFVGLLLVVIGINAFGLVVVMRDVYRHRISPSISVVAAVLSGMTLKLFVMPADSRTLDPSIVMTYGVALALTSCLLHIGIYVVSIASREALMHPVSAKRLALVSGALLLGVVSLQV